MKKINKQCGYNMYLLIFETGDIFSGKIHLCTRTVM